MSTNKTAPNTFPPGAGEWQAGIALVKGRDQQVKTIGSTPLEKLFVVWSGMEDNDLGNKGVAAIGRVSERTGTTKLTEEREGAGVVTVVEDRGIGGLPESSNSDLSLALVSVEQLNTARGEGEDADYDKDGEGGLSFRFYSDDGKETAEEAQMYERFGSIPLNLAPPWWEVSKLVKQSSSSSSGSAAPRRQAALAQARFPSYLNWMVLLYSRTGINVRLSRRSSEEASCILA